MSHSRASRVGLPIAASILCGTLACRGPREVPYVPHLSPRDALLDFAPGSAIPVGEDIVICGRRVPIGAPVVSWTEPPFYDASSALPRFASPTDKNTGKLRYRPGRVCTELDPAFDGDGLPGEAPAMIERVLVAPGETDPSRLRDVVDQFVLHFDVCGISRTCFRVLQDERCLSVHFLLDIDGTIYQTLDLRDTAWHATKSNPRSIGIEIAQIGAYPTREAWRLEPWYEREQDQTRLTIPARIQHTGIRTPEFRGYTARPQQIVGTIQGQALHQYDFTREQYASLVKLTAALCRELPRIRPEAPRDPRGFVIDHVLDDEVWREFQGVLGHYHVQENKVDPGPAFDWEAYLAAVREAL